MGFNKNTKTQACNCYCLWCFTQDPLVFLLPEMGGTWDRQLSFSVFSFDLKKSIDSHTHILSVPWLLWMCVWSLHLHSFLTNYRNLHPTPWQEDRYWLKSALGGHPHGKKSAVWPPPKSCCLFTSCLTSLGRTPVLLPGGVEETPHVTENTIFSSSLPVATTSWEGLTWGVLWVL